MFIHSLLCAEILGNVILLIQIFVMPLKMSLALTTISWRTKCFVLKRVVAIAYGQKEEKKHSNWRHTAFHFFDLFDLFKSLSKQKSKHDDFRRRNVSWIS